MMDDQEKDAQRQRDDLESRIKSLEDAVEELQEWSKEIDRFVRKLYSAFFGDEFSDDKGLIDDLFVWQKILNAFRGWGFLVGIVIGFILPFLTLLFIAIRYFSS